MFRNQVFQRAQDLRWGTDLVDKHKELFCRKKIVCRAKIDGEQQTVYSNTFVSFSPTIFYTAKK